MDEKRLLLAVALSLAVLLIWQMFFAPEPPPETPQTETTQAAPPPQQGGTATPEAPIETPETPPVSIPNGELTGGTLEAEPVGPAAEITVKTDLYTAVFSTAGGSLKSFKLNKFKETGEKNSPLKELITPGLSGPKGPLSINLNIGGRWLAQNAIYTSSAGSIDISGKAPGYSQTLSLKLKTAGGYSVERTYKFTNGDYRVNMEVKVAENPVSTAEAGAAAKDSEFLAVNWYTHIDPDRKKSRFGTYAAVTFAEDKLEKLTPDKIKKKGPYSFDNPLWTGFEDSYFMSVIIPEGEAIRTVSDIEGTDDDGIVGQRIEFPQTMLSPGKVLSRKFVAYMGPKEYDSLKAMGENLGLEQAVGYGKLKWFIIPLLWTLKLFQRLVHNWGLAIILLTVFIKLIFYPLTRSSYKQMKAMQALQPRIKELQEKHKGDRTKLNEEMMALYRTQKVNPLGGCLPMLLQLPILYGLYRALYVAIELRHAAFVGWITDLSGPEHLFGLPFFGGVSVGIMPLFMGASMYVQQKMTPTTMDPAQAKIFMMMPIMFTVISFGFPSGLVLYWSVSNLLTIAQQYVINRRGN